VLIAFWLSIHLQKIEAAKLIYDMDPIIEKTVNNLRIQGKELIEQKRKEEEEKGKSFFKVFQRRGKTASQEQSNQNAGGSPSLSESSMRIKDGSNESPPVEDTSNYNNLSNFGGFPAAFGGAKMSDSSKPKTFNSRFGGNSPSVRKKTSFDRNLDPLRGGISGTEDLKELKWILHSTVAIPFNTNIMKIALNFQEEKIAR